MSEWFLEKDLMVAMVTSNRGWELRACWPDKKRWYLIKWKGGVVVVAAVSVDVDRRKKNLLSTIIFQRLQSTSTLLWEVKGIVLQVSMPSFIPQYFLFNRPIQTREHGLHRGIICLLIHIISFIPSFSLFL